MVKRSQKSKNTLQVVGWILCGLMCAFLIAILIVNIFMRVTYSAFYHAAEPEFPIPGIDQGFIPQDLDYMDADDIWLFSGYVSDGPSPIYMRTPNGSTKRIFVVFPDGTPYADHGSGITSDDTYVFLTCENGLLVFNIDDVANATDGATVTAVADRQLDFSPAFLNIENKTLYLGNFYRPGNYETPEEHHIATPDGGENPAVMYAYPADTTAPYGFAEVPECVYSITEQIQGMCESPTGEIVLSQSYGLATSHLLAYDTQNLEQLGTFVADGAEIPLYSLNTTNFTREIETPPMSEGIEFHEGRVWIAYESAADRYLFGKLYGGSQVFALMLS